MNGTALLADGIEEHFAILCEVQVSDKQGALGHGIAAREVSS